MDTQNLISSTTVKYSQSRSQILQEMAFKKKEARKALIVEAIATGCFIVLCCLLLLR